MSATTIPLTAEASAEIALYAKTAILNHAPPLQPRPHRDAQHLVQRRPVDSRAEPVGRHGARVSRVVLAPVLHRKGFSKGASECRDEPVRICAYDVVLVVAHLDEVTDHVHNEINRQSEQIALHRVLHPLPLPVVVDRGLDDLIFTTDADLESFLNAPIDPIAAEALYKCCFVSAAHVAPEQTMTFEFANLDPGDYQVVATHVRRTNVNGQIEMRQSEQRLEPITITDGATEHVRFDF